MPITAQELQHNTEGVIKSIMLSAPREVGCIVVFVDNESGTLCSRAMRLTKERVRDTLQAIINGYGTQIITPGVDRE